MAGRNRRTQARADIWPGFVDALASLLMVTIFVLMIFFFAKVLQDKEISGRDEELDRLNSRIGALADLLAMEQKAATDLGAKYRQLTDELQATVSIKDDLAARLRSVTVRAEQAEEQSRLVEQKLVDAAKVIEADREIIALKVAELTALGRDVEALKALEKELEARIGALAIRLDAREKDLARRDEELKKQGATLALTKEELERGLAELVLNREALAKRGAELLAQKKISKSALAQMALLNQQVKALREQMARLNAALEASEKKTEEQGVRIANLGQRLNAALAAKVSELGRYRSEFFGRLREMLGNRPGIQIKGDRFVFQSEVLFETGSADLGDAGRAQLAQLGATLRELSEKIPADIDWILRVDGHTDSVPIATGRFPSNWELSTARAISVVRFLVDQGISPTRLAATGFGEFQPIDTGGDEIGNRRNRRIELKLTQR